MKKITDERLILRNLQNIRITYLVQTLAIILILGYELVQGGLDAMTDNPVWLVFMLSTVVNSYLSISISVENEREIKNPQKNFLISSIVLVIIVAAVMYLTSITPGFDWQDGGLIGAIIFICGFIPIYYVYRLRMKQKEEFDSLD